MTRFVTAETAGRRHLHTSECYAARERLMAEGAHAFGVGDRVTDGRDVGAVVDFAAWCEVADTRDGPCIKWRPGYYVETARGVSVWPEWRTGRAAQVSS